MSTDLARHAASIYDTVATLSSLPGPLTSTRYAIVTALGNALFSWTAGDTSTADDISIISAAGGGTGNWLRIRENDRGSNLTDASVTIDITGNRWRVLPAATLTANRTITIDSAGAVAGDQITITRLDSTAHTLAIVNGGPGAGTLTTLAVSKKYSVVVQFDGTNWLVRQAGEIL